jgi:hypothetical protein
MQSLDRQPEIWHSLQESLSTTDQKHAAATSVDGLARRADVFNRQRRRVYHMP